MKAFSSWGEVAQVVSSVIGLSIIFATRGGTAFGWVALPILGIGILVSVGHLLNACGLFDRYRIHWQGIATLPEIKPDVSGDAPPPISWGNLEIEDGRQNKTLSWPMKIRLVLRNDSASSADIGPLDWISHIDGAQLYVHGDKGIGWYYQVEKFPDGAKRDTWQDEARQISVPPGAVFRLWIGLSPTHKWADLDRMRQQKKLGTLTLPVAVGGKQALATIQI